MIMFMTWILSALLIVLSQTGLSDADPIYGKVGGSIVLNPGPISETIQSATWKHNADLAVEWFGQELVSYRTFKGRCDFDKKSGNLTINNLTLEDRGSYTPEINNKVLEMKELQVIKPVPKPTVSIKCNEEKTSCSLTCEAQVSAGFGPVTYKWKTGDTDFSTDKEPLITTENKESSFFCELVNPVSSSSSETVENPLIADNHAVAIAVPVVIILLVVAGIVAALLYRKGHLPRLRELLNRRKKTSGDDVEAGTKMNSSGSNGKLNKDETESATRTEKDGVPVTECVPLLNSTNTADEDQKPTSETMEENLNQRPPTPDSHYKLAHSDPVEGQKPTSEPIDGNQDQRSPSPESFKSFKDESEGDPLLTVTNKVAAAEKKTGETKKKPESSDAAGPINMENQEGFTNSNWELEELFTHAAPPPPTVYTAEDKTGSSDAVDSAGMENKEDEEKTVEPKEEPGSSQPEGSADKEKNQAAEKKTGEIKEKPGSGVAADSVDMENKGGGDPLLTVTDKVAAAEEKTESSDAAGSDKMKNNEEGDPLQTDTNKVTADGSVVKVKKGKPDSSQAAGPADMHLKKDKDLQQAPDPANDNQVQIPASPTSIQPNSNKSDENHQQASGPADNNQIQKTASPISFQLNSNKSDVDQKPLNTKQVKTPSSLISSQPNSNESDGGLQQASDRADNNQVQIPASPTSIQPNSKKSDADQKPASEPINTKHVKTPSSLISSQPSSNESNGDHQQSTDSVDKWKGQTTTPPFSYQQKGNESDNSSLKQSGEKTPDPGSEGEKQS